MTDTNLNDQASELEVLNWAIKTMLLKDGDRDHMNHSDLNCNQSMAICSLLKHLRHKLYPAEPIR